MKPRASLVAALFAALGLCLPAVAVAHPMGNFSISHYAGLTIGKDTIELRYVIDMAEIPTFQEVRATGITPNPRDRGLNRYLAEKALELKSGLVLELDGHRHDLQPFAREVVFPPGAGGLPTMKLGIQYRAVITTPGGVEHLHYEDRNFPARAR